MKIAIVGSGISGLTAASILHRRHEITVYEANDYIGGHTNTVALNERGRTLPIDTGFIVFNKRNYPNLCRLFDALDVKCRDSDMSFSVHCERSGLEYNGASLRKLFVQPANLVRPSFRVMLSDILRFNREAPHELTNGLTDSMTVARYLASKGYGPGFRDHYLLPLGASLWSCPAERFREFSMRFVIEFLHNHGMLQVNGRPVWKTVVGGSHQYVRRLTKEFHDRVRLNTPVQSVARRGKHVDVRLQDNSVERFAEVILAAHADQSLQLMENLYEDERHTLSFFPYQQNEAVLHTDTSLLPDRRAAWASWNYRIPSSRTSRVAVTYNMNMLQGLDSEQTYCVSLNQTEAIDSTRILKCITYTHPLFIPGRDAAQAKHPDMIRRGGISYCGAYWGFGFHEDGVRSALAVCDAFGMSLHR